MMTDAGFQGYYTNHSVRATTATCLFQEKVPEQLIMEQTGHRSSAINSYKKASDEQKRHVSDVIQRIDKNEKNTTCTRMISSCSKQNVFTFSNSEIHFHL